jgi:hypothetical protein
MTAHREVYKVFDKKMLVGIAIPKKIHCYVLSQATSTREKRMAASRKRDAGQLNAAKSALQRLYPGFPKERVDTVVHYAFKKRSGRVGRAGNLSIEAKVALAIQAYARHAFTHYDDILRECKRGDEVKRKARKEVRTQVQGCIEFWKGEREHTTTR